MRYLIFQEKTFCRCFLVKDGQYQGYMNINFFKNKQEFLKSMPNIEPDDVEFFNNRSIPAFTILIKESI